MKSCYQDFDTHHRGFVTESQVSYLSSYAGLKTCDIKAGLLVTTDQNSVCNSGSERQRLYGTSKIEPCQ